MRCFKLRLPALLLALTLLLSGCTLFERTASEPAAAQTPPQEAEHEITLRTDRIETLFTVGWSPSQGMNPFTDRSAVNSVILPLLYEGLFRLTPDFEAEPVLCEAAESSADGMTWRFTLKKGIRFSNNTILTSADVVYSLELARQSELYGTRLAAIQSIETGGLYQVMIKLSESMGSLPLLLDVPIIRSNTLEAPIGTGPYTLVRTQTEDYLEHTENWHGGETPIGRIYLYEVSDMDSVRDAFEFGHVDMVVSDLNAVGAVNFHSNYELWSQDTTILQFLSFNEDSPIFSSASVRAAVTHAIDRQSIITELFDGYGVAAVLPAHPRSSCYDLSLAARFGYEEMKLNDAAINAGVYGRRGTLLVNADNASNVAAAQSIADSLRSEGLEISVLAAAGRNYTELLEKGGYDLAYCEVRLTPDFDLSAFFGGSLSQYAIANVDAPTLCTAALENSGNFYDLHKLIMEQGLMCPILFKSRAVMTDRGAVSGLNAAPDNVFYGLSDLSINRN